MVRFCRGLILVAIGMTVVASPPGRPGKAPNAFEGFVLVHGGSFQMGDLWADGAFAMGKPQSMRCESTIS